MSIFLMSIYGSNLTDYTFGFIGLCKLRFVCFRILSNFIPLRPVGIFRI